MSQQTDGEAAAGRVAAGKPERGTGSTGDPQAGPASDETAPEDSPVRRSVKAGAKWGSLVGFIIAQVQISAGSIDTPFGSVYGGNMLLVYGIWCGFGGGLGALIGWLNTKQIGEDDDARPPSLPLGPYN